MATSESAQVSAVVSVSPGLGGNRQQAGAASFCSCSRDALDHGNMFSGASGQRWRDY